MTNNQGNIKIYHGKDGTEISVQLKDDNIWLDQKQIADIFGVQRPAITKHISNIFKTEELDAKVVCSILEHTTRHGAIKGKTQKVQTKFYNLDMIISVGYRINSKQATQFRIWANKILKQYLLQGHVLNQNLLKEKGLEELETTINLFKNTLQLTDLSKDEAIGLLDIVTKYTNSWLLLQKYDEDSLANTGKTIKINYKLESQVAYLGLTQLKKNLIDKGQATELFANPREEDVLEGIFGNIYQTFGGKELYGSTEEKAAHLLYFIIKNHPFTDGNKRSGAFLFIVFLVKNKLLFDESGERKINDRALVAITLLIAESHPRDKEIMVKLVLNLIN